MGSGDLGKMASAAWPIEEKNAQEQRREKSRNVSEVVARVNGGDDVGVSKKVLFVCTL